jgi:hypothetical protein
VDVKIMLKRILKKCDEDMDWIHLAEDRDQSHFLTKAGMNLQVP